MRGIVFQLPAQLCDMGVDRTAHHVGVVPPHFLQQFDARHDIAGAIVERKKEVELLRSQSDGLSSSHYGSS